MSGLGEACALHDPDERLQGVGTLGPTWPWIDRGIEFPFLMGFPALHIAVRGSRRFALDRRVGRGI